jgi:RNA polymerase sigma-70 factor (ECF subfamily)
MVPSREDDSEVERRVSELRSGIEVEKNFSWIFSRYHRSVFRFFVKRRMPPDRSEDLTQEVFLRVHRGIGGFRGDSKFKTWLFHIVWNHWLTELRSAAQRLKSHTISLEEADDAEETPAGGAKISGEDPLESALTGERKALIHREIEKMPAQMRRCITLRVDRGLKYREIADLLQISIDAVKSHLNQARVRLKQRLGEP